MLAKGSAAILGVQADAKRTAGERDVSVLTLELLREEIRARRARGERIDAPLPTHKAELVEVVRAARRAAPSIPQPPAPLLPPPLPACRCPCQCGHHPHRPHPCLGPTHRCRPCLSRGRGRSI